MKKAIFVLVACLVLISLAAIAGISYLAGRQSAMKDYVPNYPSNISKNDQSPASPETIPDAKTEGIISGILSYPSEFVPKGRVKALNIQTKQVISIDVEGLLENVGTDKFAITVPAGTYYLKYEACPDENQPTACLNGYYTEYDGTDPNKTHDLIPVKVKAGETVTNIKISDFYQAPTTDPGF